MNAAILWVLMFMRLFVPWALPQGGVYSGTAVAGGSLTLRHTFSQSCPTTTLTCAVTLGSSIPSNDLLLVTANYNAGPTIISSMSACGTYVPSNDPSQNWASDDIGWVYPSSSCSSSVNVVGTGATPTATFVTIYDYSVTGSPVLDAISDASYHSSSVSTYTGPGITLTGTGDAVLVSAATGDYLNAVNGSWTDKIFSVSPANPSSGTADQINVTSVTAPLWTANSASSRWSGNTLAWGFGATPCKYWGILDGSAGTNGNTPGSSDILSETFGVPSTKGSTNTGDGGYDLSNVSGFTYATAAHHAILNSPVRFCYGGTTYPNASSLGFSQTTGTGSQIVLDFPSLIVSTAVSACLDYNTNLPNSGAFTNVDEFTIGGGGPYATIQMNNTGSQLNLHEEFQNGTSGGSMSANISSGTWYILCIQSNHFNGGQDQVAVYDITGTLISSAQSVVYSGTTTPAVLQFGPGSAADGAPTGSHIYIDNVSICFVSGAACPLKNIP